MACVPAVRRLRDRGTVKGERAGDVNLTKTVFGGYAVTPTSCNTPDNTERVCNQHKPTQANELEELVATTKSLSTLFSES